MVVLFAVGVMSITWMLVLAAIVFAEKVLPDRRARCTSASRGTDRAAGIWVAVAPDSVPGLTRPGGSVEMNEMLPSAAPEERAARAGDRAYCGRVDT